MTITVGSLFSGIGGLDLGLERAGMTVKWQVEIDDYCRRVLAKHWPDVPRYGDIKELDPDDLEPVDLICGGFPCQPVSLAGKGLAQADERWLWPEYARIVRCVRPRYVLVENVGGLLAPGRGMGDVLGDLATLGFDADWARVSACDAGAPHLRQRVFILAYPNGQGREHWRKQLPPLGQEARRLRAWQPEAAPVGVADGVHARVERCRALGNAVVPQVAEYVGRCIVDFDRERVA